MLLAIAAIGEAATGLLLLAHPPIVVHLLFGAEVAGAGIGVCRIAGIALLALGIACWPGKGQTGALLGMTTYSALATLYLASLGFGGEWVGRLLWPAVGVHAVLTLLPGAIKHDFFTLFPRNHLSHEVTIEPGSRLATALGQEMVSVNSLHHQGIRDLAPGLSVVAHAPDGLIEAVEVDDHPFGLGVQWHPENLYVDNPDMLALFHGLVEAARAVVRV